MSDSSSSYFDYMEDPYRIVIGKTKPEVKTYDAMESWSRPLHHPNLGKTIDELNNWDRASYWVPFGDVDEDGVYKLSSSYVDRGTGVIEDVRSRYFLGGTLLEKVKRDFDRYVIGSWQTARQHHKEFPHHTNVKLSRVLDPSKDPQPRGLRTGSYIEIKSSDIKGYSDMCLFVTETPKGTSFFEGRIYYFGDGTVGRTESRIIRNEYRTFIVKTFIGGRYGTEQIEYIYDSKYGVIYEISKTERRRLMNEKSRWEKAQREERERLAKKTAREQKAAESAAKAAERAVAAQERKKRSEEIEQYIIDNYDECTQVEIAHALGITPKAVEHRVSRLRKQGVLPLVRGGDTYRDPSEIAEEERKKNEAKEERERVKRTASIERARKKEEEKAQRDAKALEEKERSDRIDQYIIDNHLKYHYYAIGRALGIKTSAVEYRIARLRREGRIPPAPSNSSWMSPGAPRRHYNAPPFDG